MGVTLTIVSGKSGCGKSVVLNILEDLGYYCIDNLPLDLLPSLQKKLYKHYKKIAVSVDARNLAFTTNNLTKTLLSLKTLYRRSEILFLSASDDCLVKRFSETRRKHPLSNEHVSLLEALHNEQTLLSPLEEAADWRIDTSELTSHQLRNLIRSRIMPLNENNLSILFQSFGYKYGTPIDSDFIFDVRCLPNPHWETHLRDKTGFDPEVENYLLSFPEVEDMYTSIRDFILKWLPAFEKENRRYLTISIGCTGGRHRSIYLVEKLANYFSTVPKKNITVRHRNI